jgi:hypothetical protein
MLGRVTEVALFTDRLEVKKTDMTDAEIDKKLKEKLNKFMNVTDVDAVDIEDVEKDENPVVATLAPLSEQSLTSVEGFDEA